MISTKDPVKDIKEIKSGLVQTSKKGFLYFFKNIVMIVLILLGIFIITNFGDLMNNPDKILNDLKNSWWIVGCLFIIIYTIYLLGRSMNEEHIDERRKTLINGYLEAEKEEELHKQQVHQARMKRRIEIAPLVSKELKDIILDLGASRAIVAEMHNGTNNLNGLPFLFADAVFEEVSREVEYVSDEYNNFNIGKYPFVSNHFEKGTWIGSINDVEKEDRRMASKLRIGDNDYGAFIVIQGTTMPLGFLIVTFSSKCKDKPSDSEILAKLNKSAQVVSNLLSKDENVK